MRYLEKLPLKYRKQVKGKIDALARNPRPVGSKKLLGVEDDQEPVFRIRSGDYRILYVIRTKPEHIVVLDIDHRKDVYR